jgi:hypothetical protein
VTSKIAVGAIVHAVEDDLELPPTVVTTRATTTITAV